ncbi:hypothetical protein D3C72_2173860 [compost metagenome]
MLQGFGERGRVAATHEVFRQHAGGVRQGVVGARLDRLDRRADVEVIQVAAGQRFTEFSVHRQDSGHGSYKGWGPGTAPELNTDLCRSRLAGECGGSATTMLNDKPPSLASQLLQGHRFIQ